MVDPQEITVLETENGRSPFEEWYYSLKDKKAKARILARIDRLREGNFGDWKNLSEGVFELRITLGLLLVGGIEFILLVWKIELLFFWVGEIKEINKKISIRQ